MACTEENLRALVEQFEKCAVRQGNSKNSEVRLRASERDLLGAAEKVRDFTQNAVKGDKTLLEAVYGGTCEALGRLYAVLDSVTFSEMHQKDERWAACRGQLDLVKTVLTESGSFKPWTIGAAAPQSLKYPEVVPRFSPGDRITLNPVITGAKATEFRAGADTELPASLRLNKDSGVISGQLKPGLIIPTATYVVVGANNHGETSAELVFAVAEPPPETIVYDELPDSILRLSEQVSLEPKVTGGFPSTWTVTPDLPEGLKLDAVKGFITGIPRKRADNAEFTIVASNSGGEAEVVLAFSVKPSPPTSLIYSAAEKEYPCGCAVYLMAEVRLGDSGRKASFSSLGASAEDGSLEFNPPKRVVGLARQRSVLIDPQSANRAMHSGLSFTVSPELPDGLSISELMGVISGKPTKETDAQTYTITAKNESGETSTELEFEISFGPPENLQYAVQEGAYYTGEALSLYPEIEGVVAEWILEGEMPEGLSFNSGMGSIEGIPTKPCGVTLKVIAKNEAGEVDTEVALSIKIAPPSKLEYQEPQAIYPLLRKCAINPSVEGQVDQFAVTPGLPAGLALDPKTGVISGEPTAEAEETTYEVTATNTSGSASASVTFGTQLMAPTALCYPQIDDLYYYGEEVSLEPLVEGGATNWAVEPALPDGMKLNEATGKITGAPSTTKEEASYTITASNTAGGTSQVIVFMVTAPAPVDLKYPSLLEEYNEGSDVQIEASLKDGACGTWVVEPALPDGLALDEKSGAISGKPIAVTETATYTVTVSNIAGRATAAITFKVGEKKAEVGRSDGAFAKMIEGITDLDELRKLNPSKTLAQEHWQFWMVHRVFLDDPELTTLDMSQMHMPLPHDEPRLAPKLMQAIATNTSLKTLNINNINLQTPQGFQLADALKSNHTLEVFSMEANCFSSRCIEDMAKSVKETPESSLREWRFAAQGGQNYFGRPAEQAIAEMMEGNKKMLKLGVAIQDPHWRQKVDTYVTRNQDIARRERKAKSGKVSVVEKIAPKEKQLGRVVLAVAPEAAVFEIFDDDNDKLTMLRKALGASKKLPTREQLQSHAKKEGIALKFSEVAPLITEFRTKLLDAFVEKKITVFDPFNTETIGTLSAYTVKNDKWLMDIWPNENSRFFFKADAKPPSLEVSDAVAEWLVGGQ